ncbi:MAG: tetratricopeptide repeat protein [Azonexus sp.]|jgi:thioredoxin-like negative regulator of GroEL
MFSKIAYWLVWTALTAVVLVLVYKNTDWFKPAADKAMDSVKSVVSKVPTGPFAKDTTNEKLTSAREAFGRGDVNGAVASYNDVIKSNTNNADARGELGNVYYLTGQLPQAAQAYYDAANLLLDKKEFDRVEPLLPVIAQINPMMADELIQKLHAAMDATMMAPPPQGQYPQQPPQSALTRH